jgi:hypothetical protein
VSNLRLEPFEAISRTRQGAGKYVCLSDRSLLFILALGRAAEGRKQHHPYALYNSGADFEISFEELPTTYFRFTCT